MIKLTLLTGEDRGLLHAYDIGIESRADDGLDQAQIARVGVVFYQAGQ